MKIREGFLLRNVAGNNVVVPIGQATLDFNGMMSLNETGAFLFEKMIEGTTKEQLIEQLMSQYEIDADTAKNDVEEFIEKVKKENLFDYAKRNYFRSVRYVVNKHEGLTKKLLFERITNMRNIFHKKISYTNKKEYLIIEVVDIETQEIEDQIKQFINEYIGIIKE